MVEDNVRVRVVGIVEENAKKVEEDKSEGLKKDQFYVKETFTLDGDNYATLLDNNDKEVIVQYADKFTAIKVGRTIEAQYRNVRDVNVITLAKVVEEDDDGEDPGKPVGNEITVTVKGSGLGVKLNVEVKGYEDAVAYKLVTDRGVNVTGDNPINLGEEVSTIGVNVGDTVKVTLVDSEGSTLVDSIEVIVK